MATERIYHRGHIAVLGETPKTTGQRPVPPIHFGHTKPSWLRSIQPWP